ncbi:MAG: hypothetical protein AB7P49_00585 [Bdellovibrionales bacterium]
MFLDRAHNLKNVLCGNKKKKKKKKTLTNMGDKQYAWDGVEISTFDPNDDLNSDDDYKYSDQVSMRRLLTRKLLKINSAEQIKKRATKMANGVFANRREGRTSIPYRRPEYAPDLKCRESDDEEYEDQVEQRLERQERRRRRQANSAGNTRKRTRKNDPEEEDEGSEEEARAFLGEYKISERRPILHVTKHDQEETASVEESELLREKPSPSPFIIKYAHCQCRRCIKKHMFRCDDEGSKKKEAPMFLSEVEDNGDKLIDWEGEVKDIFKNECQDSCPVCFKHIGLDGTGAKLARVSVRRLVRGWRYVMVDDDGAVRRRVGAVPVDRSSINYTIYPDRSRDLIPDLQEAYVHHFINNGISPVCTGCFKSLIKAEDCEYCRRAYWPQDIDDGVPVMCLNKEVAFRNEYNE